MLDDKEVDPLAHEAIARSALGAWWRQGARTMALRGPDWAGLQTTPTVLAMLVIVPLLLALAVERAYIEGPAQFYWQGLQGGWLTMAVLAWVCWLLLPQAPADRLPGAAALFTMLMAQWLPLLVVSTLILFPLSRIATSGGGQSVQWVVWVLSMGAIAWHVIAEVTLIWRSRPGAQWRKGFAGLAILGGVALNQWLFPAMHWYPGSPADAQDRPASTMPKLTQESFETQARIFDERMQALRSQTPGRVDVYAITFAPYEGEEVFRRESDLVADVMRSRFDADGRVVELINHRDTGGQSPWATTANLRRTILRIAQVLDREEDILFIHLTSHGARDGKLSAWFWPLDVDPATPELLSQWLDEAGIRYRVVSVSACYSGSWIAPLSGPGTLVMTAADATHTSAGCGRRSELTYFGRAVYDEQMRKTLSFEAAHAAARPVIEQREREAGKNDGFSNPQIAVGEDARRQLDRLARELASNKAATAAR